MSLLCSTQTTAHELRTYLEICCNSLIITIVTKHLLYVFSKNESDFF